MLVVPLGYGMLEALFEKAVALKSRIDSFSSAGVDSRIAAASASKWVIYTPEDLDSYVMGVDSGWNYRLYTGFYVYAMRTVVVDEVGEVRDIVPEMNILSGDAYASGLIPETYLKYRAEMDEHLLAGRAVEDGDSDLVLVDGSLLARLTDISYRKQTALVAEYMANATPLKGIEKIAFVSKYSHDKALFQGMLGDVYYINRFTDDVGYTIPHLHEMDGFRVTTFYVRLQRHADALHVEVPAEVGEKYVKRFIDMFHTRSVRGYPYVLRIAHNMASISDQLMETLCETAGLKVFPLAREVLR